MKKALYTAPPEELYALEKRARAAQALAVAASIIWAATALKSTCDRALTALTAKVVRHA